MKKKCTYPFYRTPLKGGNYIRRLSESAFERLCVKQNLDSLSVSKAAKPIQKKFGGHMGTIQ